MRAEAMRAWIWIAMTCLCLPPGCGGGHPEVWLAIGEDGTKPCLGAAHMEIQVITAEGVQVFHEFGQFFNGQTHACALGQYRYGQLPLGRGVQIAISMWDSTSDTSGQLSSGASLGIDIEADSPTTQLEIPLTRTSAALGTLIVSKPADWANVAGINKLQYRVTPVGESIPVRSGFFSYAPDLRADPFPLIVSALPISAQLTEFQVTVEALRDADLVRAWNTTAWLGTGVGQNPYYVQFP
jgi:hypothetical protein